MPNAFDALKTYGDLKREFNQAALLNAIRDPISANHIHESPSVLKWASEGVCAGLTVHWLRNQKKFAAQGDNVISSGLNLHYMAEKVYGHNIELLLESQKMHVIDEPSLPILPDNTLDLKVPSWLANDDSQNPARAYIECKIWRGDARPTGHSLGIVKKRGQRLEFFDANAGWFQVQEDNIAIFMRTVHQCYQDLGSELTNIELLRIKK